MKYFTWGNISKFFFVVFGLVTVYGVVTGQTGNNGVAHTGAVCMAASVGLYFFARNWME